MTVTMDMTSTRKAKRKIKKSFYICFSGIFFSFSAFRAVIDLQSSVNIEHGLDVTKSPPDQSHTELGPVSGAIINATGAVSSLTIVPLLLKRYGAKKSLIISEIFYLCYVLGNFYAIFATMIPVSVLAGISEALIFPAMSVYSVYFATVYANFGSKSVAEYVNKFAGKFFAITYLTHVVGNLLSYAVMHLDHDNTGINGKNFSEMYNDSNQTNEMNYVYCGAKDCQDPSVTSAHIKNYVTERKTLYILLTLFVLLLVVSLLIHCFATPELHSEKDDNIQLDENINMILEDNGLNSKKKNSSALSCNTDDDCSQKTAKKCQHERSFYALTCETLRATMHQIKSPKQLLLMSINIYCGMELTIVVSEISRAYVSCILGVEQLGLANVVYGTLATVSAYLNGQVASKVGRNVPFASAFVIDMTAYVVCLKWIPTEETTWIIFVICGCYGYTSGIWQTLTNAMCVDYFEREREVAFTVWSMLVCCGIAIQFAWSTLLCVDQKLYVNMTILCVGIFLYGIAELVYKRKGDISEVPINLSNDNSSTDDKQSVNTSRQL